MIVQAVAQVDVVHHPVRHISRLFTLRWIFPDLVNIYKFLNPLIVTI